MSPPAPAALAAARVSWRRRRCASGTASTRSSVATDPKRCAATPWATPGTVSTASATAELLRDPHVRARPAATAPRRRYATPPPSPRPSRDTGGAGRTPTLTGGQPATASPASCSRASSSKSWTSSGGTITVSSSGGAHGSFRNASQRSKVSPSDTPPIAVTTTSSHSSPGQAFRQSPTNRLRTPARLISQPTVSPTSRTNPPDGGELRRPGVVADQFLEDRVPARDQGAEGRDDRGGGLQEADRPRRAASAVPRPRMGAWTRSCRGISSWRTGSGYLPILPREKRASYG